MQRQKQLQVDFDNKKTRPRPVFIISNSLLKPFIKR